MSNLPPVFSGHLFNDIDDPGRVEGTFTPFIQELHEFLNELPCLGGLQKFRRKFMEGSPGTTRVFGSHPIMVGHWYTFNRGGRNEMQFNIGMFGAPDHYVRVGMGFNFARGGYGNPQVVYKAFDCFTDVIRKQGSGFQGFVDKRSLEVEYILQTGRTPLQHISGGMMEPHLRALKGRKCDWIFIGRLLRRCSNLDLAILQNQGRLKQVVESVFTDFLPYWKQTLTCQKGT